MKNMYKQNQNDFYNTEKQTTKRLITMNKKHNNLGAVPLFYLLMAVCVMGSILGSAHMMSNLLKSSPVMEVFTYVPIFVIGAYVVIILKEIISYIKAKELAKK